MSDDFWILLDEAIDNDENVDLLIPYDCVGLSEMEYLQILAVLATYGKDKKRSEAARKKLMIYESRGNSIL